MQLLTAFDLPSRELSVPTLDRIAACQLIKIPFEKYIQNSRYKSNEIDCHLLVQAAIPDVQGRCPDWTGASAWAEGGNDEVHAVPSAGGLDLVAEVACAIHLHHENGYPGTNLCNYAPLRLPKC